MTFNIEWKAVSPGVMELPTTRYRIEYSATDTVLPFRAFWGDQLIAGAGFAILTAAKRAVDEHMAEMIEIGFEP